VTRSDWRGCATRPASQIAKALTGTWQPEHVFVLKQSLELYDFYTAQVATCDAAIDQHFSALSRVATAFHPSTCRVSSGARRARTSRT